MPTPVSFATNGRTLVTFGNITKFHVLIENCTVKNLGGLMLSSVKPNLPVVGRNSWSAGIIAAKFIQHMNLDLAVKLLSEREALNEQGSCGYAVRVYHQGNFPKGFNVNLSGRKAGHSSSTELFDGTLDRFIEFARSFTGLEHLIQHIIKFDYDGGTVPGTRLIRVEKVTCDTIEGYDLSKGQGVPLTDCYRQYKLDSIRGDVEVIH